jgi:hypothetical protein
VRNPQTFDIESEDLIAAKKIRSALKRSYSDREWNSVEQVVATLIAHNEIDPRLAQFILDNTHRFIVCEPPTYFDARWHLESSG